MGLICEWYWSWMRWSVSAIVSAPLIIQDQLEMLEAARKDREEYFQRYTTEVIFKDRGKDA